MSTDPADFNQLRRAFTSSLHEHWVRFLIEGILLLVLGLVAIVVPPLATLAVAILFGWLFLISGVVGLIMTFQMRRVPGFGWSLLSAAIGIVAGVALLVWPLSGALSLTLVLVVFFVFEGVASIMYALDHRRELSGRWGLMAASGAVDLILAAIIVLGLPGAAAWVLGILVGLNMMFGGLALIGMALHARGTAPL